MDKDNFNRTTAALAEAARLLAPLDLAAYVADIRRDQAFGCFFDAPMTWSSRQDVVDQLGRLAEAGIAFRNAAENATSQALTEIQREVSRRTVPS